MDRAKQFADALQDLHNCGYLTRPMELEPSAWSATPTIGGFLAAAYELACRLPGQLWPSDSGVSWVCGRGGPHGLLVNPDTLPGVTDAQRQLAQLGCIPALPWTRGRLCRAALSWVADIKSLPVASEHIMEGIPWGYHSCTPGNYQNVAMFDVRAYYYGLLRWLPSLRVAVNRRLEIEWLPMSDLERDRWEYLLQIAGSDKLLRNSLAGCAMGGKGSRMIYQRGPGKQTWPDGSAVRHFDPNAGAHRVSMRLPATPWRAAGLVLVRAGAEMAMIAASETGSVYTTVDSVVTRTGGAPTVWKSKGFAVELKASGDADIRRRGSWRVGNLQTPTYAAGYRVAVGVPNAEIPPVLTHASWVCP